MKKIILQITWDDVTEEVETKCVHKRGLPTLNILNDEHYSLVLSILETSVAAFVEQRDIATEIDELTQI